MNSEMVSREWYLVMRDFPSLLAAYSRLHPGEIHVLLRRGRAIGGKLENPWAFPFPMLDVSVRE